MALQIYNQLEATANAFARVLVLGPAKAGKTTSLTKTAPKPLVLNCDGFTALKGASNQGAEFQAVDICSIGDLRAGCSLARKLCTEGKVRSVILDTATLLVDLVHDELAESGRKGFDLWRDLDATVGGAIKDLLELQGHLFVVCHMQPEADTAAGILPAIPGKLKLRIPAMLDDWILLTVNPENGAREFLLGAQGVWTHSGRNIKRVSRIPADVGILFKELGIEQ